VTKIDPRSHEVVLADGSSISFDRLLLATGAEPVPLAIPGADQPNVRELRTMADCQAIIERAKTARRREGLSAAIQARRAPAGCRIDLARHRKSQSRVSDGTGCG
jgi:NAD(P)H-nitrite reductase large subunit